jgi:hypothetical protein
MKLIGFDIMDRFFQTCKQELLQLQKDFEIRKRMFNPVNGQNVVIKLPQMVPKTAPQLLCFCFNSLFSSSSITVESTVPPKTIYKAKVIHDLLSLNHEIQGKKV